MIGYNGFNTATHSPNSSRDLGGGYSSHPQNNQPRKNNDYLRSQVLNASPERILIMLFDGAIRFIREAIKANKDKNLALKLEKIGRVFNIITEFSSTLDHKIGGEIAENLDALYQFNLKELGLARRDEGNKHLEFVENFLVEWRETWTEVIEINRMESSKHILNKSQEECHGFSIKG
jgi:flagellar protein FliS